MDVQDTLSLIICPICTLRYDDSSRAPKIIPCKGGHTICATCVATLLNSNKILRCPFDKEKLNLRGKGMQGFTSNLAFRDVITMFNSSQFCELHGSNQLELYCMECKKRICSRCDREHHKGHTTEFWDGIWKKAEETLIKVKNCVSSIDQLQGRRKACMEIKESELINLIKSKMRDCDEEVQIKGEILIDNIKEYFSDLKEKSSLCEKSNNSELFVWKSKASTNLACTNPKLWESRSELAIPCVLFQHAKTMRKLGVEKWIKDEKTKLEVLQLDLENISMKFIEQANNIIRGEDPEYFNLKPHEMIGQEKIQKKIKTYCDYEFERNLYLPPTDDIDIFFAKVF